MLDRLRVMIAWDRNLRPWPMAAAPFPAAE